MQQRTLIIGCADPRCEPRLNFLFRTWTEIDGIEPYRVILAGGVLMFAGDSHSVLSAQTPVLAGVTHVHAEDHLSGKFRVPGCAGYRYRRAYLEDAPDDFIYPPELEEQDHLDEMGVFPDHLREFYRNNLGRQVQLTTSLFYNTDSNGNGKVTILNSDLEDKIVDQIAGVKAPPILRLTSGT